MVETENTTMESFGSDSSELAGATAFAQEMGVNINTLRRNQDGRYCMPGTDIPILKQHSPNAPATVYTDLAYQVVLKVRAGMHITGAIKAILS